jgi:Flp pilus assembly protein TadG
LTSEEGSMAVAMSAAVALIIVTSVAVAGLGALYSARAQAQNAADAAALAAAVATYPPAASSSPREAARLAAGANQARVMSCACPVDGNLEARVAEVVVGVEADVPIFGQWLVRAGSRAEFDPSRWLGR